MPRVLLYTFYRISDNLDTINLLNEAQSIDIDRPLVVIPFNYEREGQYLFKVAFKTMENYDYNINVLDLDFEFDKNNVLHSDTIEALPITIKLDYPYTLILDTMLFNNYQDLLDKVELNLEHLHPP